MSSGKPVADSLSLARTHARRTPWVLGRLAPALLAVGLAVAAVRTGPALLERYGYRAVERRSVGTLWQLTLLRERRRAAFLPIPVERLRVLNQRDEEVARLHGDGSSPVLSGSFHMKWKLESVETGLELEWSGMRLEFVPDAEGVLVPAGSLSPRESEPGDEYRPRDSLRLYPAPD